MIYLFSFWKKVIDEEDQEEKQMLRFALASVGHKIVQKKAFEEPKEISVQTVLDVLFDKGWKAISIQHTINPWSVIILAEQQISEAQELLLEDFDIETL